MNLFLMPIGERLVFYEAILRVARSDEEIIALLAAFGYVPDITNVGNDLYHKVLALYQAQKEEYGEQYTATAEFNTARKTSYVSYLLLVKLARIALKNDKALIGRLELHGKRGPNYSRLSEQMESFYTGAENNPKVQAGLARFNITSEKLWESKDLFEAMRDKRQVQKKETSEAQRATKDRDAAMEELDDWMSDFIAVSKIALAVEPQYLERMGIVDPS